MKIPTIIATTLLATSCATAPSGPLVDTLGVDAEKYKQDRADCQIYSLRAVTTGQGAASVAIGGALFGAIIGAALGMDSGDIARTAGGAAAAGAAKGAVDAAQGQDEIWGRCLEGRGYRVLAY